MKMQPDAMRNALMFSLSISQLNVIIGIIIYHTSSEKCNKKGKDNQRQQHKQENNCMKNANSFSYALHSGFLAR